MRGVKALHGGCYSIIPDQIEAGTYMAAAAAVGGDVLIENVIPKHLDCITAKLREIGADITGMTTPSASNPPPPPPPRLPPPPHEHHHPVPPPPPPQPTPKPPPSSPPSAPAL